jgi:endo-1,4-beta-xylanase
MILISGTFFLARTSAASTLGAAAAAGGRVFGAAVSNSHLSDSQYVTTWDTEFTGFTPENEMKWDTTEPSQNSFNFSAADTLVSHAQQHNMKIRGHTLVWHNQLPGWVSSISSSSTLLSVMNNHITTETTHFQGKIWYWDVVNEAFNEDGTRRSDVFQNLLGNSYIETAFRTAHAADPNAKLCYNDYNIEDMNGAKSQAVYAMVADFKNRGVPIDCVGFQSHFIVGQIPGDFQATLQKFANLGIDVQITELDIRMPTPASTANLSQQATDYSNVVKACFAVSRCNDITVWGITDKYSWVPGTFPGQGAALLFDDNYNKKPAYNSTLTALNGAPQVTPTPTSGGGTSGVLRSVASNKCLDVSGVSTTNGTLLQIWDCWGGVNQKWTSLPNGELQVYGNKCLDVPNHATAQGTRVQIWDCNGGANQQWTLNANGTVVGRESGLCLDVTGGGTANGTAVELWPCHGGSNQQWTRQ